MSYHVVLDAEYRIDPAVVNRARAAERKPALDPAVMTKDRNWAALSIVTMSWLILHELGDGGLVPVRIETRGVPEQDEAVIIAALLGDIAQLGPKVTLVTWGGTPIDIRHLVLATMSAGTPLPPALRGLGRPLERSRMPHIDLMTALCDGARRLHMSEVAARLGVPAKLVCKPDAVIGLMRQGKWSQVRAACECDVVTTALIHIRHRHLMGLGPSPAVQDMQLIRHIGHALAHRAFVAELATWGREREACAFADEAARMAILCPQLT